MAHARRGAVAVAARDGGLPEHALAELPELAECFVSINNAPGARTESTR